ECVRSREPASRAILPHRSHRRLSRGSAGGAEPGLSADARPAPSGPAACHGRCRAGSGMTGPVSNKPAAGVSWRLLDGYPQDAGGYDEMLDGGDLRAHCEPLVRSVEALGRRELASRWERARRAVRDNGVTYNVHGDPQGLNRPWELDMMPLVIPPSERCQLEAAPVQRTRLCDQILADLSGQQRLLPGGLV